MVAFLLAVPTYWTYPEDRGGEEIFFDHPTPLNTPGTLRRTLESLVPLVEPGVVAVSVVAAPAAAVSSATSNSMPPLSTDMTGDGEADVIYRDNCWGLVALIDGEVRRLVAKRLLCPLVAFPAFHSRINQRHLDVRQCRHARQQVESLEDESDFAIPDMRQLAVIHGRHALSVEPVFPCRRAVETADDIH